MTSPTDPTPSGPTEPTHPTPEPPGTEPPTPGDPGHGTAVRGSEAGAPGAGSPGRRVSRRGLFGATGATAAALGGGYLLGSRRHRDSSDDSSQPTHTLRGDHQPGILTPAQDSMFTAAYDLRTTDRRLLRVLLRDWTVAAEQMMAGDLVGGAPLADPQAPPTDTGEAWGYPPSNLTLTFGLGRGVFVDPKGRDRYGLRHAMPEVLDQGMPKFANEALRSHDSDGDLLVQACADDAQVAMHAIRNLTRIAFGKATMRWSQVGYGRTSSTSTSQETPRNLFGFKDGTNNVKAEDGDRELSEHLWVGPDDDQGSWLAGGTYYVARRIRMFLEVWDRLGLGEQEDTFGRDKMYGAPLSVTRPDAAAEFRSVDYSATGPSGRTLVPADSHIAVVSPQNNGGRRMLRRGYNYTDGIDSLGRLDAGLFFVAFVRDPRTNFYPILNKMASSDALSEYLQHQASALFAIPPGRDAAHQSIAQTLLG